MDGTTPDASELLRQARQGDADALGQLLDHYRAYLRLLAERRIGSKLGSRVDASDIVQTTFLQAHRAFGDFRGGSDNELAAWLSRILDRNVAGAVRDHVLLQKRAVGGQQSLDAADTGQVPLGQRLQADQSSPSHRAMRGEQAVRLARALETLPEDQREAVRLRHLEGWSLADISAHLGRSPSAVAGLLKRGMQSLRAYFDNTIKK